MTDLRDPHPSPARPLFGSFSDLGSPVAAEIVRPGRLRLARHRPRARRRRPRPTCSASLYAVGHDADGRPRPTAVGASGCGSGARSTSARHGIMVPRVDLRDAGRARRSRSCATRRRARAASRSRTRGAGLGRARPRRRPGRSTTRSLGIIQIEIAERGRRTPTRSPRSTGSTSCSSARPTCRTASASRGGSTTRLPRRARTRRRRRAERHGKAAGILLYDAGGRSRRHLELGFRFIGLGSDGAFVTDGAQAMLAAAGRALSRPRAIRPWPPRPRLPPTYSSASRTLAGSARPAVGPVWATSTPDDDQRPADELDGRQR